MGNKKQIIVVVPFAREADALMNIYMYGKKEFLERHREEGYFMLFINDKGWDDSSKDRIFYEVFGGNPNCKLLHNKKSGSIKGGAVYTGLAYALESFPDAALIGFTDLDDSLDLEQAFSLLSQPGDADLYLAVRGTRALPDRIASMAYSFMVKLFFPRLFPIRDLQAGFKFFTPAFLEAYFSHSKIADISFGFDSDLLLFAEKESYRLIQQKVIWHENDNSARNILNIIRTLRAIIRKRFFPSISVYRFDGPCRDLDEDRKSSISIYHVKGRI